LTLGLTKVVVRGQGAAAKERRAVHCNTPRRFQGPWFVSASIKASAGSAAPALLGVPRHLRVASAGAPFTPSLASRPSPPPPGFTKANPRNLRPFIPTRFGVRGERKRERAHAVVNLMHERARSCALVPRTRLRSGPRRPLRAWRFWLGLAPARRQPRAPKPSGPKPLKAPSTRP
jgi:hypothetical protein